MNLNLKNMERTNDFRIKQLSKTDFIVERRYIRFDQHFPCVWKFTRTDVWLKVNIHGDMAVIGSKYKLFVSFENAKRWVEEVKKYPIIHEVEGEALKPPSAPKARTIKNSRRPKFPKDRWT